MSDGATTWAMIHAERKALAATIETLTPEQLGVDPAPRLKTLKVGEPPKRKSGVKVKSVAELVDKLRNESKVI